MTLHETFLAGALAQIDPTGTSLVEMMAQGRAGLNAELERRHAVIVSRASVEAKRAAKAGQVH